jgi:hypothetical protein
MILSSQFDEEFVIITKLAIEESLQKKKRKFRNAKKSYGIKSRERDF